MIVRRRLFKQDTSDEDRLANEAASLRAQADLLPPGALRQEVLRKARQCETDLARVLTSDCAQRPIK